MNRNLKKLAFCAMYIASVGFVSAQERKLPLDEAIYLSLQHSNQLKLSKAKTEEAVASLRSAQDQRLPSASISGSYIRINQPNLDLKLKLGGSSQSGNGNSGGQSEPSAAPSFSVNEAAYAIANVSLPLFAGFKISSGIESAKFLKRASELDAEKDREEVIANAIAAYSNLYKASAAVELVQENLKTAKQRVTDFSNLEQNGLMARNDLLKAQLQQSNVELTLLDAENNRKLTCINMNLMLGLPQETILVPDAKAFVVSADAHQYSDWETLALSNRKDIQSLDYRIKAANVGVRAAKGDYYPSVALTGGYLAAYIPNVLTVTNALNGGVGVKYSPSSLWTAGAKVSAAKARLNEAQLNEAMLLDAVRLQVAQAYQTYLSNLKKIDVYEQALAQASENYRIVRNKQQNELATTTELLDADVAQLQAHINAAYAKADALVAFKKLQQMVGVLSESTTQKTLN
ncbi:MAG: TolC family protein [Bacteroidetes bacterium]|nr:TolC family protein [Bacteroidota bacterium]